MSDFHVDPFFIAVPELSFNIKWLELLKAKRLISNEQYEHLLDVARNAKKADKIVAASMRGDKLINRLLAVGSELLSVDTVNILRSAGLVSEAQGHALRIAVRSLGAAGRGGLPSDKGQIFSRLLKVVGVNVSYERIDLWRSMGLISAQDAERWRGYLRTGNAVKESLSKAKRAKSLMDALLLFGEFSINRETIAGLVQAGIINAKMGRVYNSLVDLGVKQWTVFKGAGAAEGWRRRALLILTGSLNQQLLDSLLAAGIIDRTQWASLQIAEQLARRVNDRLLEDLVKRRFRVKPGEAPIKTFARASRVNDGDLLRLLELAARESAKEAEALAAKRGIGAATRAAQYRLAASGLHQAMRSMWENVGYLTIFGEREAAEAAAESAEALSRKLLKNLPADYQRSILWQSKAGVDSYISREENTLRLSRLVYKNMAFYEGRVDQRIKLGLLRGQSAAELARDIEKFISPRTPGGSAYAAMRLARTEINNAFHFSFIRNTREQPWTRGYKWNLSGSHGKSDICNQMATDDHDDIGSGVYKKGNVPGKPHPHCLCYVTAVLMDESQFIAAFRAGRFSSYLKQVEAGFAVEDTPSDDFKGYLATGVQSFRSNLR